MYTVIIIDIIESRKLSNAKALIASALENTLKWYDEAGVSGTLTHGDEIQFVVPVTSGKAPVFEIMAYFAASIHPIRFRAGIGTGDIFDYDAAVSPTSLDGPAFWNAREAIGAVEKSKRSDVAYWCEVDGMRRLFNHLTSSFVKVIGKLNDGSRKYFLDYLEGQSAAAIAEKHGISKSAVYSAFKRYEVAEIKDLDGYFVTLLELSEKEGDKPC